MTTIGRRPLTLTTRTRGDGRASGPVGRRRVNAKANVDDLTNENVENEGAGESDAHAHGDADAFTHPQGHGANKSLEVPKQSLFGPPPQASQQPQHSVSVRGPGQSGPAPGGVSARRPLPTPPSNDLNATSRAERRPLPATPPGVDRDATPSAQRRPLSPATEQVEQASPRKMRRPLPGIPTAAELASVPTTKRPLPGLPVQKLAAMADARLDAAMGPRLRGPHLPAASANGRIAAPSEALARFAGLLEQARGVVQDPVVGALADRAMATFLDTPTSLYALVALNGACRKELAARGLSKLASDCEQVVRTALRDPVPTLQQMRGVLQEEAAKLAGPQQAQATAWIRQLDQVQATLVPFAKDPVASMASASACIAAIQQEVHAIRSPLAEAKEILERRADTMSFKHSALFGVATRADAIEGLQDQADAVDRARWRLEDAAARKTLFELWTKSPMAPVAMVTQEATIESLASRALAARVLGNYAERLSPEQATQLHFALLRRRAEPEAYASLPEGANLFRHAQALAPADVLYLISMQGRGYTFGQSLAGLNQAFAVASNQPLDQEMRRDMVNMLRLEMARAPVEAKAMLAAADPLEGLDDRLVSLSTQLAPSLAEKNDGLHQRAFETLLVSRLIDNCPPSTLRAWSEVGEAMYNHIFGLTTWPDTQSQMKAAGYFRRMMADRGQRPWDAHQPEIQNLVRQARDPAVNDAHVFGLAAQMINEPATAGYDVLTRANLVRDLWLAMSRVGVAPAQDRTNEDYANLFSPKRDLRVNLTSGLDGVRAPVFGATAPREATGIMGLHQPLPEEQKNVLPATQPGLKNYMNINAPGSQEALEQGGAVLSGVSGSTNILLHTFEWARRHGEVSLSPANNRDIALGAMQFVVHDGGHSMYEVMYVFDHALDGRHAVSTDEHAPQSLAQLKSLFADDPGVQKAFQQSASAMAKFDAELNHYGA